MEPTLTPYLNFNGNAVEAMKYYQFILGGELTMQTFAEANMAENPNEKGRIVHASLKSEGLSLMASDTQSDSPPKF
jgi:PhnB protein